MVAIFYDDELIGVVDWVPFSLQELRTFRLVPLKAVIDREDVRKIIAHSSMLQDWCKTNMGGFISSKETDTPSLTD